MPHTTVHRDTGHRAVRRLTSVLAAASATATGGVLAAVALTTGSTASAAGNAPAPEVGVGVNDAARQATSEAVRLASAARRAAARTAAARQAAARLAAQQAPRATSQPPSGHSSGS